MFDRITRKGRRVGLVAAVVAAITGSAVAAPEPGDLDRDIRNTLAAFDRQLRDGPRPEITASELIAGSGLTQFVNLDPGISPGVAVQRRSVRDASSFRAMDLRLALGQISQLYGATDNQAVVNAQTAGELRALVVDRGTVTLADLFQMAQRTNLQRDGGAGENLLRVPVVIAADATLVISPGEVLRLSRPEGAYLANFGRLEVQGALIESVGPPNPLSPSFVPFVVNGGGAQVSVRNSHFRNLGFGSEGKFGGFAIVRNPLLLRRDEIVLEGNTFERLNTVALSLANNVTVRNNRFRNSKNAALSISRTQNAKILGNLFFGPAPTNAIRLNVDSTHARIAGNVIMHGDRAGISVRSRSNNVTIENNVIYNRGGAGATLKGVNCGVVRNNIVIDNRQKGIEIREGARMVISGNYLIGNRSPGVYLADQAKDEATLIRDNLFIGNGAGLGGASGERFALIDNNFVKQFPRFVQGDLANQTDQIVKDLRGESPLVLTSGGPLNVPVPNVSCSE